MAASIINAGILERKNRHAATLKARRDRIKQEQEDIAMAGVRQKER